MKTHFIFFALAGFIIVGCTSSKIICDAPSTHSPEVLDTIKRLKSVEIPSLSFSNTPLHEAVSALNKESERRTRGFCGIRPPIRFAIWASAHRELIDDDPFALPSEDLPNIYQIHVAPLMAKNISFYDAVHLIADVTDKRVRIDQNVVILYPCRGGEELLSRYYPITEAEHDMFTRMFKDQSKTADAPLTLEEFLKQEGARFAATASATLKANSILLKIEPDFIFESEEILERVIPGITVRNKLNEVLLPECDMNNVSAFEALSFIAKESQGLRGGERISITCESSKRIRNTRISYKGSKVPIGDIIKAIAEIADMEMTIQGRTILLKEKKK